MTMTGGNFREIGARLADGDEGLAHCGQVVPLCHNEMMTGISEDMVRHGFL